MRVKKGVANPSQYITIGVFLIPDDILYMLIAMDPKEVQACLQLVIRHPEENEAFLLDLLYWHFENFLICHGFIGQLVACVAPRGIYN